MTRHTQRNAKFYLLGSASAFLMAAGAQAAWAAEESAAAANDDLALVEEAQAQQQQQQEEGDEETLQVEEIVITGSRIKRESAEVRDLTIIGEAEFESRGFVNAIDALEDLPLVGPGSNREGGNVQFGDNNAFVDLLNLGTERTLTLVNGKRFVSSNQATVFVPDNAPGAQVDLTIINPSLIERTEVETGTGGPIYGADAVAGVLNVILKDDFEGFEIQGQGGLTEKGDGGQYRFNAAWGGNYMENRLNITAAVEVFDSDMIRGGGKRNFSADRLVEINNPLSFSGTDGVRDQLFEQNVVNPIIPRSGVLTSGQQFAGGSATFFFPNGAGQVAPGRGGDFNNFVGQTGMTPFEFAQSSAGRALNPLLFVGTFGDPNSFLTVPNQDPETNSLFPRRAVPFTFDGQSNPTAFSLGSLFPPNLSDQNSVVGGDGFNDPRLTNLRSAQERYTGNLLWRFDITDTLTYKGNFIGSSIQNRSAAGTSANSVAGNPTAGSFALPIFIDENPFLTPETLSRLNDIEQANLDAGFGGFQTMDGSRVAFLNRALFDLTGGLSNIDGNDSRTYRTSHELSGEFEALGRDFYWDTSFVWGKNRSNNIGSTDLRDIEFALATDVVADANGNPVCRQQTLDQPEAINVRNPFLSQLNIARSLTPDQSQIDACVPLNLFGDGAPSQEAVDFVTTSNPTKNESTQFFIAGSIGGDVVELPAGTLQFNSQFEWRREHLEFSVGETFGLGLGRFTIGQPMEGTVRFFEGGTEFLAPIFNDNFKPFSFGMELFELEGAVRVVSRTGEGSDPLGLQDEVSADGTIDVTYMGGGRWSPVDGVTFRGTRSKAVRSASIVELFGAPQTAFSARAIAFPCNAFFGSGGPASGIRQQNCQQFAQSQGTTFAELQTLVPPNQTIPVGVAGNPNLVNETANNWQVGVVLEPDFIPGLTISSDYLSIEIDDNLDLAAPEFDCFDQPGFPNSVVGGVPVCENTVLAVEDPDNPGSFIIPEVNPITGNPTNPVAGPGNLATVQQEFTVGFAQFAQINQGSTRLRALNSTIDYNFGINDMFDALGVEEWLGGTNLGVIRLVGNVYWIQKMEQSSSGTFDGDITNLDGEPGNENIQSRLDFIHSIGPLTHRLQWFRTSESVLDRDESNPADAEQDFFRPDFNTFNYNVQYEVNQNITARVIVNNLTNAQLLPEFGVPVDTIGRSFEFVIEATF